MTSELKIIRAKVGLLELAKQVGNVSQSCKLMGYSRPHPVISADFFLAASPISSCATTTTSNSPTSISRMSRASTGWR